MYDIGALRHGTCSLYNPHFKRTVNLYFITTQKAWRQKRECCNVYSKHRPASQIWEEIWWNYVFITLLCVSPLNGSLLTWRRISLVQNTSWTRCSFLWHRRGETASRRQDSSHHLMLLVPDCRLPAGHLYTTDVITYHRRQTTHAVMHHAASSISSYFINSNYDMSQLHCVSKKWCQTFCNDFISC